jgi:hypothetical protein
LSPAYENEFGKCLYLERMSVILLAMNIVTLLPLLNLTYAESTMDVSIDGPNTAYSDEDVTLTGSYSESISNDFANATMSSGNTENNAQYNWQQTGGSIVDFSPTDQNFITFRAPVVNSETDLTFELTVTGPGGSIGSDSKSVTIMPVSNGESTPTTPPGESTPTTPPGESTPTTPPGGGNSISIPGLPPLNVDVPTLPPLNVDILKNPPLPLWLIGTTGLAVVIIPIAVHLARRHGNADVPLGRDMHNQTPKSTIEIETEGGLE